MRRSLLVYYNLDGTEILAMTYEPLSPTVCWLYGLQRQPAYRLNIKPREGYSWVAR